MILTMPIKSEIWDKLKDLTPEEIAFVEAYCGHELAVYFSGLSVCGPSHDSR